MSSRGKRLFCSVIAGSRGLPVKICKGYPAEINQLLMRHTETTKLILPYARPDTDASFQCNEGLICIYNSHGRGHAYFGWTIAACLIVFPLTRTFLPGTTWFAFDERGAEGWFGMLAYLFTIFACVSTGFWWSTVKIDLRASQIERRSRWGPFSRRTVEPLSVFHTLRLSRYDGDNTVELEGSQNMQIVWGRKRKETVRIARELASRVSLPLVGEDEDEGEPAAG